MNWLNKICLFAAAFLVVFWQAAFQGVRHLFGAQPDLLPAIMVYASLCESLPTLSVLALLGGFWFDSLSANPLGLSVLPLFVVGLPLYLTRELILRDQLVVRVILGFAASVAAPSLCLLFLLTTGQEPLFGWGTLWQLLVMGLGGAVATPLFFELFEWLKRALSYSHIREISFRPDREIPRGRT